MRGGSIPSYQVLKRARSSRSIFDGLRGSRRRASRKDVILKTISFSYGESTNTFQLHVLGARCHRDFTALVRARGEAFEVFPSSEELPKKEFLPRLLCAVPSFKCVALFFRIEGPSIDIMPVSIVR